MRWQKMNGALFPVRVVQDQLPALVSLPVTNPWIPGRSNKVKLVSWIFGVWVGYGNDQTNSFTHGP